VRGRCVLALVLAAAGTAFVMPAAAMPTPAGPPLAVDPCAETLAQPFLRWGDTASYALVSGGGFEAPSAGWSMAGGAALVLGNESFFVNDATDQGSLSLPVGSSATSGPICASQIDRSIRLFVSNTGNLLSTLRVDVLYATPSGVQQILRIARLAGGPAWLPSPALKIHINGLASASPSGAIMIALRFTPEGSGAWRIDDLYIDPFKHRTP
jgi:hypothetical protein